MLKNFKPISLILLAGATCFPASIFAETMPSKQGMNISQQNGKVTGTVVDDLGPVAGASVVVKGTTNGNITDMDGNFTLEGVKNGGDRQELHERIRVHSMDAGRNVKVEGKENDLIERILADDYFNIDKNRLMELLDPKNFIGFAAEQTVDFVELEVKPIIEKNKELLGLKAELHV